MCFAAAVASGDNDAWHSHIVIASSKRQRPTFSDALWINIKLRSKFYQGENLFWKVIYSLKKLLFNRKIIEHPVNIQMNLCC